MVRKLQQRRVRGALDRFGPPLQSSGGNVLSDAEVEASAYPQESLEVEKSYLGQGRFDASLTKAQESASNWGAVAG
jgi:hypothetical protein